MEEDKNGSDEFQGKRWWLVTNKMKRQREIMRAFGSRIEDHSG